MSLEKIFKENILKRFESYKEMGDKTFAQLTEENFFFQPSAENNTIAVNIQHMYGNMLSRFTNFLTEDGEKSWRKRDAEFEISDAGMQDLLSYWNEGWACVFKAIKDLEEQEFSSTIYIREEPMSVCDALLRQLGHYAYHIGQIIFIAKMIKGEDWKTLTIPKKRN